MESLKLILQIKLFFFFNYCYYLTRGKFCFSKTQGTDWHRSRLSNPAAVVNHVNHVVLTTAGISERNQGHGESWENTEYSGHCQPWADRKRSDGVAQAQLSWKDVNPTGVTSTQSMVSLIWYFYVRENRLLMVSGVDLNLYWLVVCFLLDTYYVHSGLVRQKRI